MSLRHDDWRRLVVYCAGTAWDGARGTDRQLATRLSRLAPVLFVDPPRPARLGRRVTARLRVVEPRIANLSTVGPPGLSRAGIWTVTEALTRRAIRRSTVRLGGDVHAVVVASSDFLFGACNEHRRVLYGTDDLVAGSELLGIPRTRLVTQERRLLTEADTTIAVSPPLVARWQALGAEPRLLTNGCDVAHLAEVDSAPMPDDVVLPPPIAGLAGHVSDRFDFSILESIADRGVSLLLVGPCSPSIADRIRGLCARPNVQHVGPQPYEAVNGYLRMVDVGVVPYALSEFNNASFPLKLLEFLGAGRPVVTTDLPAARWLGTAMIDIATNPVEFADMVVRRLSERRTPAVVEMRRSFAGRHSWERRAEEFGRLIGIT